MKWMGMILLVAAIAALSLSRTQADDKTAKDDKRMEEVKKLDVKMSDAILKGDTKFIEEHTADDYKVIDATGHVWNRKQNLEFLKSGKVMFDSMKDTDVKVQFHGDVALITGLSDVKGKAKMHEINGEYRYTRVYLHRDGRWQCLSEQLTRVWDEGKKK